MVVTVEEVVAGAYTQHSNSVQRNFAESYPPRFGLVIYISHEGIWIYSY